MADDENTNSRIWEDEGGSVVFARVPPRVGIVTAKGRPGEDCTSAWEKHFPWLLVKDVSMFIDMADLESWPGQVTHVSTSMTIEARDYYDALHVLVSDPIRGMIARTVALSLGEKMIVYRERADFEEQLQAAVEAHREPLAHPLVK